MPDVWPSVKAYFTLLKAFQSGFAGATRSAGALSTTPESRFRFVSAFSGHQDLPSAVVRCVKEIKANLGCQPDFCQLLVASPSYGESLRHAPSFVQECFSGPGVKQPALIGGAVQSLLRAQPQQRQSHEQGVSVLAASLPGVDIHPFHCEAPSLPNLSQEAWGQLLTPPGQGPPGHNTAALLLAEPHFSLVDELLERLHGALPWLTSVGGVVDPGSWGSRSLRGALFLGERAYDAGAVGAILTGPLQLDASVAEGCRPIGRALRITQVDQDGLILGLNDEAALTQVFETMKALGMGDKKREKRFGVDPSGTGRAYSMRAMTGADVTKGGLKVSGQPVPEGSLFRLHVRDQDYALSNTQEHVEALCRTLPEGVLTKDPQQLGAMLFSCAGMSHADAARLSTALPSVPLQASKCQGEIGPIAGHKRSRAHAFTSSIGILRHSSLQKAVS